MATVTQIGPRLGIAPTCAALGLPRATYYRRRRPQSAPPPRRPSPRALSPGERGVVLALLHEPRFVDHAPAEVYATLLDAGQYVCSERTMYRLLAEHAEVRERRDQLRHPVYAAPELLARRPNELWSWDITKLLGPAKWTYFSLYVMLDVFSRYVVGWMVAHRESATLAEQFIHATCARQGIGRAQLTIHADRGQAMISKSVAFLLADLGVTKTHSRPHVSNDNPFSEAQFKTLKYRPAFPDRFGSIHDARAHGHVFFPWIEPNRSGNAGRYFSVLNCASENGLSLDTWGRECVLVTPRSASRNATDFEIMAWPRSAWIVSCSRPMPCRAHVSWMNCSASVALSR